eukprot:5332553-Pyramimonas_sp.AAC.1
MLHQSHRIFYSPHVADLHKTSAIVLIVLRPTRATAPLSAPRTQTRAQVPPPAGAGPAGARVSRRGPPR